jgi:ribosomal protein S18 acetylase RimI-like enzyme
VIDTVVAGIGAFSRATTAVAPDGALWERDGVVAAAFPHTPDRSLFNAVAYADPDAVRAAVPELASFYDGHGIRAWTVWVPEADAPVAAMLEAAGHVLDGLPRAMALDLDELRVPDGELDWELSGDTGALVALNEAAYGWAPGEFPLPAVPAGAHAYYARLGGERCSGLLTVDHDDDAMVSLVATDPEQRGRGLASGLLAQALVDARRRGLRTSTLQATKAGAPIYARLGYRDLGLIQMWERRRVV